MSERNARVVRLTVIDHREPVWDGVREGVPASRSECPDTSVGLCGYVRCRWHLARLDGGADGTRAGRPGLSKVTRDPKTGLTAREIGSAGDERAPTTLDGSWIGPDGELRYVATCALDEIKRVGRPMSNTEVGARTRRHRTLVAREIKKAVLKLAAEHGTTMDDLLLLADPEAAIEAQREPSRRSPRRG